MTVDELVENFEFFDDWEDRYAYLMELGDTLPALADDVKVPANIVQGCMSQVWMVARLDADGRMHLEADSDARIVRGLIAILFVALQDRPPAEVLAADVGALFQRLGLDRHISLNRRNGFAAMVQRARAFAERAA
ncbi:MAG: SufE family protein [Myxococcales bacterium]|nr:SufE family protein [Myxococcales bacterium]